MSSLSGRDPVEDYEIINRELAAYDPQLAERPQIVVATKLDALDEPERLERLRERARADGREFFEISSVDEPRRARAGAGRRRGGSTRLGAERSIMRGRATTSESGDFEVMTGRRRIALYGGTFDPVHVGHMAVARSLLELFALDEVLFIPAYVAPHKRDRRVSPALDRYAMLALATQDEDALPRLDRRTRRAREAVHGRDARRTSARRSGDGGAALLRHGRGLVGGDHDVARVGAGADADRPSRRDAARLRARRLRT